MAETVTPKSETFAAFDCQDQIEYTGPESFEGEWAAPKARNNPHTFQAVTLGGSLTLRTKHNAKRYLAPEHPANNPEYWEHVEDCE